MSKRFKKLSAKSVLTVAVMSLLIVMSLSTSVFAGEPPQSYDMITAITTGVEGLVSQVLGIIAVVVPSILVVVGAKLAITKGIGVFKSLTGKA